MAFIEIQRGRRNKYEYDKERHVFMLDRVLYSSVHYPTDYGFIPETLAPDHDPLDILVVVQQPTFPGCVIPARPIAGLDMEDEKGSDFKVVAVPLDDPHYNHVHSMDDLGPHWAKEIETFFATYKQLEEKITTVKGWHSAEETRQVIAEALEHYKQEEYKRILE